MVGDDTMTRFSLITAGVLSLAACSPEPDTPQIAASALPDGAGECAAIMEGGGTEALTDLCVISHDAMAGRLVGTPGNALARAYIIDRFNQIGVEPVGDSFEHPFSFERRIDFRDPDSERRTLEGVNLIARIPGTDSSRVMAVTAHFDHLGAGEDNEIFNGADDNASGVAGLLAVARHFADNPPEHDVVFIAFDAEEGGLNGARHFVDNVPDGLGEIALNLNLDMLGYSPDGDIWAAGTYHTPGLLPIVEAVAADARLELNAGYDRPTGDPREDWTLLSDHGPFHVAGIDFLYIGVEDHEHYHQASDEFETIDPVFFNAVIDMVVDLAGRLDADLAQIAEMERRGEAG
jgi:hypothetical protein